MNIFKKKFIEFQENCLDFLLCCLECIKKQQIHIHNIQYYNLDDFKMDNSFFKENIYYQSPVSETVIIEKPVTETVSSVIPLEERFVSNNTISDIISIIETREIN